MKSTAIFELHKNVHFNQIRFPTGCWMFAFEWDSSKTRPRYNSLPVFIKLSSDGQNYNIYNGENIIGNISPYESKARYVNNTYEEALTNYKQLVNEAIKKRKEYLKNFIINQEEYLNTLTNKIGKLE